MGIAAAFLDGGYVEKVFQRDHNEPKVDFEKLVHVMVRPDELLRAYYYHCLPYQSNPPTEEERQRYAARHRFTTALSFLPRFEVRLGQLAFRGIDAEGKYIFQQKRVDCMVGVDMALLAAKGKITNVAVFTGDSDIIPALEAVKREGVLVTLWHGSFSPYTRPSRELVEIADERRQLTSEIVNSILLVKKKPTACVTRTFDRSFKLKDPTTEPPLAHSGITASQPWRSIRWHREGSDLQRLSETS